MKGYIKNTAPTWAHILKRSVGPGSTIDLEVLYEQYGIKHNLAKGDEFIGWLKNVKLKNKDQWKIILVSEEEELTAKDSKEEKEEKVEMEVNSNVPTRKMDVKDVVGLSVRKAREVVPTIMDVKLLKYAISEARNLAGKDSLCNILRKRVNELQLVL